MGDLWITFAHLELSTFCPIYPQADHIAAHTIDQGFELGKLVIVPRNHSSYYYYYLYF